MPLLALVTDVLTALGVLSGIFLSQHGLQGKHGDRGQGKGSSLDIPRAADSPEVVAGAGCCHRDPHTAALAMEKPKGLVLEL